MISIETQARVAKIFLTLAQGEHCVENNRRTLSDKFDFDNFQIFKNLDAENKDHINSSNIINYLCSRGIRISQEEAQFLILFYDQNSNGVLSYPEFVKMVTSNCGFCSGRGSYTGRSPCCTIVINPLSPEIDCALKDLLDKELCLIRTLTNLICELRTRSDYSVEAIYNLMNYYDGINRDSLRRFLLTNYADYTEIDLDNIIKRLDFNKDNRVDFVEFKKFFGFPSCINTPSYISSSCNYSSPLRDPCSSPLRVSLASEVPCSPSSPVVVPTPYCVTSSQIPCSQPQPCSPCKNPCSPCITSCVPCTTSCVPCTTSCTPCTDPIPVPLSCKPHNVPCLPVPCIRPYDTTLSFNTHKVLNYDPCCQPCTIPYKQMSPPKSRPIKSSQTIVRNKTEQTQLRSRPPRKEKETTLKSKPPTETTKLRSKSKKTTDVEVDRKSKKCPKCDCFPCICCKKCKEYPCKCCIVCHSDPCTCCPDCHNNPCTCIGKQPKPLRRRPKPKEIPDLEPEPEPEPGQLRAKKVIGQASSDEPDEEEEEERSRTPTRSARPNGDHQYEEKQFIDYLKKAMKFESQIECCKRNLACLCDFNCPDAFKLFGSSCSCELTLGDIKCGFNLLGLCPTDTELLIFLNRYDLSQSRVLSYQDFFDILVPYEESFRASVEQRCSKGYCCPCKCPDVFNCNTLCELKKILNEIINGERLLNSLKKAFGCLRLRLKDLFANIDTDDKGYFEEDELKNYLKSKGAFMSDNDTSLLFIRLDKNRDGRVDYDELEDEFKPIYK